MTAIPVVENTGTELSNDDDKRVVQLEQVALGIITSLQREGLTPVDVATMLALGLRIVVKHTNGTDDERKTMLDAACAIASLL